MLNYGINCDRIPSEVTKGKHIMNLILKRESAWYLDAYKLTKEYNESHGRAYFQAVLEKAIKRQEEELKNPLTPCERNLVETRIDYLNFVTAMMNEAATDLSEKALQGDYTEIEDRQKLFDLLTESYRQILAYVTSLIEEDTDEEFEKVTAEDLKALSEKVLEYKEEIQQDFGEVHLIQSEIQHVLKLFSGE